MEQVRRTAKTLRVAIALAALTAVTALTALAVLTASVHAAPPYAPARQRAQAPAPAVDAALDAYVTRVLKTFDVSFRPMAFTRSAIALILATPSSMLACVRKTPACFCIVARMSLATSCEYSPFVAPSSRASRASVRSAASAGSGLWLFCFSAASTMWLPAARPKTIRSSS